MTAKWEKDHWATYLGASTPETPRYNRMVWKFFRTPCERTFGGENWLKYLIAIGDIPPEAVEAVNLVIEARTEHLAGRKAGVAPLAPARHLRPTRGT